MKKHMILALAAAFIATPLLYGASLKEVKTEIANAYNTVFSSKTDLYASKMSSVEWTTWIHAINMVRDFIEKNGKDLLGRKGTLFDLLQIIENTNNNVVNAIETFYIIKDDLMRSGTRLDSVKRAFQTGEQNMFTVKNILAIKKYYLSGKKKSKDLLEYVAYVIEMLIKKAESDFRKHIPDITI